MTDTSATVAPLTDYSAIKKKAVILNVDMGTVGNMRKIPSSMIDTADAAPDAIHVTKELLESAELDAVKSFDARVRKYIREVSLPSNYKTGMYLVPVKSITMLNEKLDAWTSERAHLVDIMVSAYPALIEKSRSRLGIHFDETDYDTADSVREKFRFTYNYLAYETPETLREISNELFNQERAKQERQLEEQYKLIQVTLRGQFADLTAKMKEALTPQSDGKPRRFTQGIIDNWLEFCQMFRNRNIVDDDELQKLVDLSETIIRGTNAEVIRNSQETREHMVSSLNYIDTEISKLTLSAGRSFDFNREA